MKIRFRGLIEIVPAYASLTDFYDVLIVRKTYFEFSSAFEAVKQISENALQSLRNKPDIDARVVEIPICFDAEYALDLEFVAQAQPISRPQKLLKFFSRRLTAFICSDFCLGLLIWAKLTSESPPPRKASPRLKVPKGSVGIAGRQTGIYSLESPGGWQIIGRTNVELFTPHEEKPAFLQAGDSVKFYAADFKLAN